MSSENVITKDNLDTFLKELGKEYRRLSGKSVPAEIILIGGASILVNYGFRTMTYDMDAVIVASSAMKDAINVVGDRFHLPNGWLNTDFTSTRSFTGKRAEFSIYYRTYANVLTVRTIAAEYLIAMKLMAGRKYKNDLSDIIGILWEHQKNGNPITEEAIDKAMTALYGSWAKIPADSIKFIKGVYENGDYETLYKNSRESESESRDALLEFERKYPDTEIVEENIDVILERAKKLNALNDQHRPKESVLKKVRDARETPVLHNNRKKSKGRDDPSL